MSDESLPTRPTVDDVAVLLRARTKDSDGREVGTFTDETRPTDAQVEVHIDNAVALLRTRLPFDLPDAYAATVSALTAYRAALQIEKSYFPEQVRSDRSAYDQLREEYLDDLNALLDALGSAGDPGSIGAEGHRAHSELTPTFLSASQRGMPGSAWDWWPEPENPANWTASPFQPPREPPLPEDLPVGVEPASGTWLGGDVRHAPSVGSYYSGVATQGVPGPPGPAGPQGPPGPQGAVTIGETFEYSYNLTTNPPPSNGQVRFDADPYTDATRLYASTTSADGLDVTNYLTIIGQPGLIYIQDKDDATRWARFAVTAPPIFYPDHVEYLIDFVSGGEVNQLTSQRVLATISRASA